MPSRRDTMRQIFIIALLIVLVACAQPPADVPEVTEEPETTSMPVPAPGVDPSEVEEMVVSPDAEGAEVAETPEEAESAAGKTKEFTVRAFQFGYDPDTIEVDLGDEVIIHAYTDDVPHGFRILEFKVDLAITGKTPVTTKFTATKRGTFTFSCSIPCGSGHRAMSGTLIVK